MQQGDQRKPRPHLTAEAWRAGRGRRCYETATDCRILSPRPGRWNSPVDLGAGPGARSEERQRAGTGNHDMATQSLAAAPPRQPWYRVLYIQVLIAIALGVALGHWAPHTGAAMKPLGDAFISLIKMMIAPVIFCTVVHGIGSMGDLKKGGRVGVKTLFYFEAVSTLALALGLIVGQLLQPGKGFNIDVASLDPKAVASYVTQAKEVGIVAHLLAIIPDTFIGAFAKGDLLQVLLISVLSGFAISRMGQLGEKINDAIDAMAKVFFGIIRIIVRAAPIGAFGAMAFTVGAYGVASLLNLLALVAT